MERVIPSYSCACGWRDLGYSAERHEHMGGEHWAYPDAHPTLRLECSVDCEQSGCSLTDCLEWVQTDGTCPLCGSPARLYTEPPVKGVD
jgi:hypothetical protein